MENFKKIYNEYFERRKNSIEKTWVSTFPLIRRVFFSKSFRQNEIITLRNNDIDFSNETFHWLHGRLSEHSYTKYELSNFITYIKFHNLRVSSRLTTLITLAVLLSTFTSISIKYPVFLLALLFITTTGIFALVERADLNEIDTGNKELILFLEKEIDILNENSSERINNYIAH